MPMTKAISSDVPRRVRVGEWKAYNAFQDKLAMMDGAISSRCVHVCLVICRRHFRVKKGGEAVCSQADLAAQCGISLSQLKRAIAEAKSAGLLEIDEQAQRGTRPMYLLITQADLAEAAARGANETPREVDSSRVSYLNEVPAVVRSLTGELSSPDFGGRSLTGELPHSSPVSYQVADDSSPVTLRSLTGELSIKNVCLLEEIEDRKKLITVEDMTQGAENPNRSKVDDLEKRKALRAIYESYVFRSCDEELIHRLSPSVSDPDSADQRIRTFIRMWSEASISETLQQPHEAGILASLAPDWLELLRELAYEGKLTRAIVAVAMAESGSQFRPMQGRGLKPPVKKAT